MKKSGTISVWPTFFRNKKVYFFLNFVAKKSLETNQNIKDEKLTILCAIKRQKNKTFSTRKQNEEKKKK